MLDKRRGGTEFANRPRRLIVSQMGRNSLSHTSKIGPHMNAPLNDLNALEDKWLLGQIPLQDGTLFVRLNQAAEPFMGHPELGIKLGFAIPFNAPPEGGVPSPDENEAVAELEDQIRDAVAGATKGIHVLTLTAPEVKELVFYIAEGADISSLHELLRSKCDSHEIQCMAVRDPGWQSFRQFLPSGDDA